MCIMRWPGLIAFSVVVVVGCASDSEAPSDPPSSADPCRACTADQICVQRFDGVCGQDALECVARTVDCPANACSAACQTTYCGSPYQCQNRPPCGTESALAFTCYGP